MTPSRDLHVLAAFVHGALAALHALGLVYNLRRGNHGELYAHAAGVMFSAHCTVHHYQESK